MRSRWGSVVSAIVGLLVGTAAGLALRLNFHEQSSDGHFLYRDPESEFYKVAGAVVVCIAVGVWLVFQGRTRSARAASFGFLASLLVVLAWKMAVARVVGANFWMIGWPMFAIPSAIALVVCLEFAERVTDRRATSPE